METDMKSDGRSTTKAMEENQTNVREMVMESYRDMQAGKRRDYKKFFSEMEKTMTIPDKRCRSLCF